MSAFPAFLWRLILIWLATCLGCYLSVQVICLNVIVNSDRLSDAVLHFHLFAVFFVPTFLLLLAFRAVSHIAEKLDYES